MFDQDLNDVLQILKILAEETGNSQRPVMRMITSMQKEVERRLRQGKELAMLTAPRIKDYKLGHRSYLSIPPAEHRRPSIKENDRGE